MEDIERRETNPEMGQSPRKMTPLDPEHEFEPPLGKGGGAESGEGLNFRG